MRDACYFLTFCCYGSWLPGQAGVVDRGHNRYGGRYAEASRGVEESARSRMRRGAYFLDGVRRGVVLRAILEVCEFRGWKLLAAHVRSNHVHLVLEAGQEPELVMNALKAYASRALGELGLDGEGVRRWARHGSTRYLFDGEDVAGAIRYVVWGQGEAMEVFELRRGVAET